MKRKLEPGEGAEDEVNPATVAKDVLDALEVFRAVGAKVWVGGGWGVDALLGEQTREHTDLDVSFDARRESELIKAFCEQDHRISLDDRPTRFVLTDPRGRQVDMHPVRFDRDGIGTQLVPNGEPFLYPKGAFAEGVIAGRKVPCLSIAQQVRFHTGYAPLKKDRLNMSALTKRFGVELPEAYG